MHTLFIALIIYMLVMFFVVYAQPAIMYNRETRTYKSFGTSRDSTLFPLWMCAVVSALASYVIASAVSPLFVSNNIQTANDANLQYSMVHPTRHTPSQESVLPSPMRRATIGGSHLMPPRSTQPTFETMHTQHTPHHYHSSPHHTAPRGYAYHPNQNPHNMGLPLHQSRVWKNGMD